jgi:hypothetical protein
MLMPKKLEIRKSESCEGADKNQNESHEIEPNLVKDRAIRM